MTLGKKIISIIAAGALTAAVVGCEPRISEVKDLTGDGIDDIVVKSFALISDNTWLFIGTETGEFIRARKHYDSDLKISYFKTNRGETYILNNGFYRPLPRE